jgi:hypothetical protein
MPRGLSSGANQAIPDKWTAYTPNIEDGMLTWSAPRGDNAALRKDKDVGKAHLVAKVVLGRRRFQKLLDDQQFCVHSATGNDEGFARGDPLLQVLDGKRRKQGRPHLRCAAHSPCCMHAAKSTPEKATLLLMIAGMQPAYKGWLADGCEAEDVVSGSRETELPVISETPDSL